ncbi:hypothetical protein BC835DRAFT_1307300 [Cytidiella melzeri]|nr:hypothetical protein BC835DRAFT_1307300 [Cytidiella melzeri]
MVARLAAAGGVVALLQSGDRADGDLLRTDLSGGKVVERTYSAREALVREKKGDGTPEVVVQKIVNQVLGWEEEVVDSLARWLVGSLVGSMGVVAHLRVFDSLMERLETGTRIDGRGRPTINKIPQPSVDVNSTFLYRFERGGGAEHIEARDFHPREYPEQKETRSSLQACLKILA